MDKQYIEIFSDGGYSPDGVNSQVNRFCNDNNIKVISTQMSVTPHIYNSMRDYVLTLVYEIIS